MIKIDFIAKFFDSKGNVSSKEMKEISVNIADLKCYICNYEFVEFDCLKYIDFKYICMNCFIEMKHMKQTKKEEI